MNGMEKEVLDNDVGYSKRVDKLFITWYYLSTDQTGL